MANGRGEPRDQETDRPVERDNPGRTPDKAEGSVETVNDALRNDTGGGSIEREPSGSVERER